MGNNKDGFFAVDKQKIGQALELSMNAAISYLTIACGTSKSNTDSGWSVNAIEKYTGISRGRAKKAVADLIDNRVISRLKGGTKPRYRLINSRGSKKLEPENTYWLPNGIVMGVSDEMPPLSRIRESQDIDLLILFLDLYSEQNLLEDGGISQSVCQAVYEKVKINERAEFNVFGFNFDSRYLSWDSKIVSKHYRKPEDLTDDEKRKGHNCTVDFFSRIQTLEKLGLIEYVPHLLDNADDGEIIHELNDEIASTARAASEVLLSEHHETDYDFLVPLPRHFKEATVIGIYRTTYRPRTSLTGGWYQKSQKQNEDHLNNYNSILERF